MADKNSALPVRTEGDIHELLQVKIADPTTPSQQAEVDTDSNLHVEIHGNDPAGTDRVVRLSELGAVTPDGIYDVSDNSLPGNMGLIGHVRNATPDETHQTQRLTSITNGSVRALDISLHDANGAPFTPANPLPVTSVDSAGDEINDYDTAATVASGATSNHDYTVTALTTLKLTKIWASSSGRMKIEVQIETGVATNVFTTVFVGFNSTANPNIDLVIKEYITVAAGVRVRVARTNREPTSQDVYSTICGYEQ